MAFTLVHCADVHLETTFSETSGGAARRKALADAFARIVDAALERGADALTIGGDLYEAERAGPQTVRFLFEQFARFGKPVFIAPGNHDPHAPHSLLARGDLPENVRVFNEAAWRAFPLSEDITLFGFGHTPAEPGRPFASARFERGGVQIALVHGSDEARCPPNKRATAPFTQAEVLASGATLLLTGHYHGGYIAREGDRAVIAYPGSPEPIKFGEGPEHGVVVLQIEAGEVTASLQPISRTRLLELECDLSGATHEQAAFERVETLLAALGKHDYVRLRLSGQVARGTRLDLALMEDRFAAALGSLELR
ncbi:MAG TPA: metallophosphoesterase, partial [Candidatus Baltobacteraceae bacterium]|nr:metallophosphoesterase [Candidatus Baltobacteraceae bacterium]